MKKIGKEKGFTLLEMMIVVAILGILAAMAYPSFQSTLAINRGKYGEAEINKALAYARSEAISRNKYIGICPMKSDNPEVCATSLNDCPTAVKAGATQPNGCSWSNGFLVYVDKNINDAYDPSDPVANEEVIQHFYVTEKPLIIQFEKLNLTWKAGGMAMRSATGIPNGTISIIPSNDPDTRNYLRECTITTTGQVLCAAK